jgi:hypothetical protein
MTRFDAEVGFGNLVDQMQRFRTCQTLPKLDDKVRLP